MHVVITVPGIMGTELLLGDERVWPPTPLETQLGYKRIQKLASPDLKPGGIITRVLCLDFYQPLFDMLDELERDAKKWVPVFREKSRENKSC